MINFPDLQQKSPDVWTSLPPLTLGNFGTPLCGEPWLQPCVICQQTFPVRLSAVSTSINKTFKTFLNRLVVIYLETADENDGLEHTEQYNLIHNDNMKVS